MNRVLFGFLISWMASAGAATPVEEEVRAAVKQLGGELIYDAALPGKPIVSVNL
jgi:hypothetical protein